MHNIFSKSTKTSRSPTHSTRESTPRAAKDKANRSFKEVTPPPSTGQPSTEGTPDNSPPRHRRTMSASPAKSTASTRSRADAGVAPPPAPPPPPPKTDPTPGPGATPGTGPGTGTGAATGAKKPAAPPPPTKGRMDPASRDAFIGPYAVNIKNYKGWITRRIKAAKEILATSSSTPPAASTLDSLQKARDDLERSVQKTLDAFDDIIAADPYTECHAEYREKADIEFNAGQKIIQDLNIEIANIEHALNPAAGPPPRRPSPPLPPSPPPASATTTAGHINEVRKPNNALKPQKLTRDNTPVEFSVWISAYYAYYTTSHMHLCSIVEQHAYFKACLEPSLIARIQHYLTSTTPVFPKAYRGNGPILPSADRIVSAMEILQKEFLFQYPVFTRRLDFFKSSQQGNQVASDWISELRRQGDECNLNSMTQDDIYVMRYLTGIKQQKLCDELLKIKDPTVRKLDQRIQEWEISQRCLKGINTSNFSNKATSNSAYVKRHHDWLQARINTAKKANSATSKPHTSYQTKQNKPFICFRCGDKNKSHTCKAVNAICKHCGKKGHYAGVCNAKAKASQGDPKPRARSANAHADKVTSSAARTN